jgi:hypothetical protein
MLLDVKDNELNHDMLSRRLVRRGYDRLIATDGPEAVAMTAHERPDLIFMERCWRSPSARARRWIGCRGDVRRAARDGGEALGRRDLRERHHARASKW